MIPFSIIIPLKLSNEVRLKNLQNLLEYIYNQRCCNDSARLNYECIIVEQKTPSSINFEVGSIKLITNEEKFNKSWCVNVGIKEVKNDLVLVIDVDSKFDIFYLEKVINWYESNKYPIFMAWSHLLTEAGRDNPHERMVTPDFTRAMGGVWGFSKSQFINTYGGMNESFFGYGGEDNELYERVCAVMKLERVINIPDTTIRHQYHDWTKTAENNLEYFLLGRKYPFKVNEILKKTDIGNMEHPTPINMKALDENTLVI